MTDEKIRPADVSRGVRLVCAAASFAVGFLRGVLHPADGVLHLTDGLRRLAFDDHLLIANSLTDLLFRPARYGFRGSGNSVLIHGQHLSH